MSTDPVVAPTAVARASIYDTPPGGIVTARVPTVTPVLPSTDAGNGSGGGGDEDNDDQSGVFNHGRRGEQAGVHLCSGDNNGGGGLGEHHSSTAGPEW